MSKRRRRRKESRKKPNYQEITNSDITDEDTTEVDGGSSNVDIEKGHKAKTPENEKPKDKTFCQYLFENPLSKGPLIYFIVGVLANLALGVYYMMDNDTAYVIAGILGISLSFYGMKHFNLLLGLKKEVDGFGALNRQFRKERARLGQAVTRMKGARVNLQHTQKRLRAANAQNRENLDNFRQVQHNMEQFGKQSVEELADLQSRSNLIENKWKDQLFEHERNVLHTVFERMERQGSRLGMNVHEFSEFEAQLPPQYKTRFDRLGTFHKLAKGGSLLRYEDFKVSLDLFAEMERDDVDIEFEVKTVPKRKRQKSRKQVRFRADSEVSESAQALSPELSMLSQSSFEDDTSINRDPMIAEIFTDRSVAFEDLSDEDEEEDDDEDGDAPALYDRKVVITKRTIRGRKFKDSLADSLFLEDDEDDYEDTTFEDMFGKKDDSEPDAPGFKKQVRVTEKIGFKSLGAKQFENLFDD